MTVPTSNNREEYEGNGAATAFDYAFKVFRADDLVAVLTASDGTETTLTRGTDYSVDGVGEESGGTVTYPLSGDPLATGETLTLLREIPVVQETDLRNQGRYYPETLEDEFDRSRMIDQQQQEQLDRTLSRTRASDYFDAKGRRIANVGNAVEDQDAYTKGQADTRFANDVITQTGGQWDAKGLRIGSVADAGSDSDAVNLRYMRSYIERVGSVDLGQVQTFSNVAAMKGSVDLVVGEFVRTLGYYSPGDGGGNDYEVVGAGSGVDDGGSYIDLSGSGLQAKALFAGGIFVEQFGASDGQESSVSIQSAVDYAFSIGGSRVNIYTTGTLLLGTTVSLKSHVKLYGHQVTIRPVSSGYSLFSAEGDIDDEVEVTSPASPGDSSIAFDTIGFSAGDWLRISSIINANSEDAGEYQLGTADRSGDKNYLSEFVKIQSVSSPSEVDIEGALIFPYSLTAGPDSDVFAIQSSVVKKVSFLEGAGLIGITLKGDVGPSNSHVFTKYAKDFIVSDCVSDNEDSSLQNVVFKYSLGCRVEKTSVSGNRATSSSAGDNPVVLASCQYCVIDGCLLKGGYQSVDISYVENDVNRGGPSCFCTVRNSITKGASLDGATSHWGCYATTFSSLTVLGSIRGIRIRSQKDVVENCIISGEGPAVEIGVYVAGAAVVDSRVTSNTISNFLYPVSLEVFTGYAGLISVSKGRSSISGNLISNGSTVFVENNNNSPDLIAPSITNNTISDCDITVGPYVNGAVVANNVVKNGSIVYRINIKGLSIHDNHVMPVTGEACIIGPGSTVFITDTTTFPGGNAEANLYLGEVFTSDPDVSVFASIVRDEDAYQKFRSPYRYDYFSGAQSIKNTFSGTIDLSSWLDTAGTKVLGVSVAGQLTGTTADSVRDDISAASDLAALKTALLGLFE